MTPVSEPSPQGAPNDWSQRSGLRFIVLFGIVSLFADMAYEGARSITGPFLASLGASGLVVGVVSGVGEMLGYGLRLLSGRLADRSRLYWPITVGGYLIQLPAIPALALAAGWPMAGALIVVERFGRGFRNPARNVMLSAAGEHVGQGWGFGVHEALDQTGALIGPLVIAGILAVSPNGYRLALACLLVPALAALLTLAAVRLAFPYAGTINRPQRTAGPVRYPPVFWWYLAGTGLIAFGFADWSLVAYHLAKTHIVTGLWVPVFYAFAMGTGGLGSLVFGRLFDRRGLVVLIPVTIVTAAFAPLVFLGGFDLALIGSLLWGIGLGAHESVMSAAVASMVPQEQRGTAFGLFTAAFGVSWFVGSAIEGALYDVSIPTLVAVAIVAQLVSCIPILIAARLSTL